MQTDCYNVVWLINDFLHKGDRMEQFTYIQEPPASMTESERQYFFMEQAKEKRLKKEKEVGHPLTFASPHLAVR